MTTEPLSLTAITVARCLSGLSLEEKIKIVSGQANEPLPFCIVQVFAITFICGVERPLMSNRYLFSSYGDLIKEADSVDPFGLVKSRNVVDYKWYHNVIDEWEASGRKKDIREWFEDSTIHIENYRDERGSLCSQLLFTRFP